MKTLLILVAGLTCTPVIAGQIHDAASAGNLATVTRLVQANPNVVAERDAAQNTALHMAALNGRSEVVDYLLKHGADATATNFQKNTPAHFAVPRGHEAVVKRLVEAKPAVVNEKGAAGLTLLMLAARTNTVLVEFLIANKADLNLKCDLTTTALHFAALAGNAETVQLLLKAGANVNERDERGDNAAHFALSKSTVPPKPVLDVLIAHKVDLNAKGSQGTVLDKAKQRGDVDVVAFLKAKGAK